MTAVVIESAPATAKSGTSPPEVTSAPAGREVRHEYKRTLPALLNQLGISLAGVHQSGRRSS